MEFSGFSVALAALHQANHAGIPRAG